MNRQEKAFRARLAAAVKFDQKIVDEALALGKPRAIRVLSELVSTAEDFLALKAGNVLGKLGGVEPVWELLELAEDGAELGEITLLESALSGLCAAGPVALEPCLTQFAESDDEMFRCELHRVLVRIGERDDRIFHAAAELFAEDPVIGAAAYKDYGDPRAVPVLQEALAENGVEWADHDPLAFGHVVAAILELGGDISDADATLCERVMKELEPGVAVEQEPPRRNAPCPCGSGAKFKKCCGAMGDAAVA